MDNMEQADKNQSGFKIKDFLWVCLSGWYWFVIALVITIGYSLYDRAKTPRIYNSTVKLMIKDGAYADDQTAMFSDMSSFSNHTNLNNEIVALRSPLLMQEAVSRADAQTNYLVKNGLRYNVLYGTTLPLELKFIDVLPDATATAEIDYLGGDKVEIGPFAQNMKALKEDPIEQTYKLTLVKDKNDTIETPLGRIAIIPNEDFKGDKSKKLKIIANQIGVSSAAGHYLSSLKIEVPDNYASVLNISITDQNPQRANEVLQYLIDVYNENWIADRNQISVSTYNFINERLAVIESELGNVDSDISSYKSEHQITNPNSTAQVFFTRSMAASDQLMQLNNELSLARQVKDQLTNTTRQFEYLPAVTGLNVNVESLISSYNTKISERKNFLANSSVNNPIVIDLDNELNGIRQAMLAAIDSYIRDLNNQISLQSTIAGSSSSRMAASPTQEKYLLSVERQQKVKEQLYLYLLQKREENELSQAFTAYNSKQLSPAVSSGPINVALSRALLKAIGIGLLVPAFILYLIELMNSKVRGRKDIEHLTIPFVGEIPFTGNKKKWYNKFKKEDKKNEKKLHVRKGSGNVINEAFRVVRTNLEFMVSAELKDARTIMITSANPGSGKTFISLNLAAVLSLKGKRVMLLDLDMRKSTLSETAGDFNIGLSNFLTGQISDVNQIKVKDILGLENVDLLPVGPIPPNPAELLYSEKLSALVEQLKHEYDYVLIDCPPVEVVADAKIINRLVDLTIFVIRAGVLEREMLPEIQRFYDVKRYTNMAIILNGTPDPSSSKFKRINRFGYGYGYGYGYYKKK